MFGMKDTGVKDIYAMTHDMSKIRVVEEKVERAKLCAVNVGISIEIMTVVSAKVILMITIQLMK